MLPGTAIHIHAHRWRRVAWTAVAVALAPVSPVAAGPAGRPYHGPLTSLGASGEAARGDPQHRERPPETTTPPPVFVPTDEGPYASISARPEPAPEPPEQPSRGVGALIMGGSVTVGATVLVLFGASVQRNGFPGPCFDGCHAMVDDDDRAAGRGIIVVGAVGLVVAAVLLGVGGHRLRKWRRSQRIQALAPALQRARSGTWTSG